MLNLIVLIVNDVLLENPPDIKVIKILKRLKLLI